MVCYFFLICVEEECVHSNYPTYKMRTGLKQNVISERLTCFICLCETKLHFLKNLLCHPYYMLYTRRKGAFQKALNFVCVIFFVGEKLSKISPAYLLKMYEYVIQFTKRDRNTI